MIACIGCNQAIEPGGTRGPDPFCVRLLPETKGKSLEELEKELT